MSSRDETWPFCLRFGAPLESDIHLILLYSDPEGKHHKVRVRSLPEASDPSAWQEDTGKPSPLLKESLCINNDPPYVERVV